MPTGSLRLWPSWGGVGVFSSLSLSPLIPPSGWHSCSSQEYSAALADPPVTYLSPRRGHQKAGANLLLPLSPSRGSWGYFRRHHHLCSCPGQNPSHHPWFFFFFSFLYFIPPDPSTIPITFTLKISPSWNTPLSPLLPTTITQILVNCYTSLWPSVPLHLHPTVHSLTQWPK